MTQLILFIAGSALLIAPSWKSFHHPGSHGFYRFFAWESILGLFLLNMNFWFYQYFIAFIVAMIVLLIFSYADQQGEPQGAFNVPQKFVEPEGQHVP